MGIGAAPEGVLAAANSFVGKTVSGVGILIAGVLIDLVHFPAHATPQNLDPQIIRNLVLINTPLQFVLSAITITVLAFYKIDRTLRCHHCGFTERVPRACPQCGNVDIQPPRAVNRRQMMTTTKTKNSCTNYA